MTQYDDESDRDSTVLSEKENYQDYDRVLLLKIQMHQEN